MLCKDLIASLTKEDFAEIGRLQEDDLSKMEGLTHEDLANAFERFCKMLSGLTVEPSDVVLVALPVTEDGKTRIDAEYFEKQDFEEKLKTISDKEIPSYTDADVEDRYGEYLDETADFLPVSYAYEFTPWEKVLGATVFPENFENVGRISFASSILGEMSFNGMTREHQNERMAELEEAIREAEEISKLPGEEGSRHFVSSRVLYSEFGIEKDEKDRKEEMRLMMLDCVKTREAAIKEFKRIAKIYHNSAL